MTYSIGIMTAGALANSSLQYPTEYSNLQETLILHCLRGYPIDALWIANNRIIRGGKNAFELSQFMLGKLKITNELGKTWGVYENVITEAMERLRDYQIPIITIHNATEEQLCHIL